MTEWSQVKAIWIPCLVVGLLLLLLLALVARFRQRTQLYMLEQKRRQERLDAHKFLQEVALTMCRLLQCCADAASHASGMDRPAQTLLELSSKRGVETAGPTEVDPATGDMVFVFTDIMNSTGQLAAVASLSNETVRILPMLSLGCRSCSGESGVYAQCPASA